MPEDPSNAAVGPVHDAPQALESHQVTDTSTPGNGRRSVYQRIGAYTLVLTILGTIFLLAPLTFLGWMWLGDRSSSTWRRIMLDDFAKQAVTISAIVLRTALAVLGGVATAMIASVSIEHHGVPLQDAAQVSIARFSNSGPSAFWTSMLFRKTFIELPSRILLILLLITTLASQFTSTILLSDLGQGTVVAPSTTSTNTSGFSNVEADFDGNTAEYQNPTSPFFASPNYWTTDPTVFQAFAEYSELGNSSDGVDDTGLTLRAFLPFSDASARQLVRDFQGMAPVFDTRVVCTRPDIKSLKMDPNYTGFLVYLEGNFSSDSSLPGLAATQAIVPFHCPLVMPFNSQNGSASFWSICPLNASAGGLLPVLDPSNNSSLRLSFNDDSEIVAEHDKIADKGGRWHVADGWNVDIGNAYLISNGAWDGSGAENAKGAFNWSSVASEGPWVNVNFQDGSSGDSSNPSNVSPSCSSDQCWKTKLRMSVCYDAL